MYFEKWLRLLIEKTLPEWREHYLAYKTLKQRIKFIAHSRAASGVGLGGECSDGLTEDEFGFIRLLTAELEKINSFVEEKRRDYESRLEIFKSRIETMRTADGTLRNVALEVEEVLNVGREMVAFYGELVLLENYSVWNYIGLRKILKKYDRRICAVLSQRCREWVKCQPCFATAALSRLITECYSIVQSLLFSSFFTEQMTEVAITQILGSENEQIIYRSSAAALDILSAMVNLGSSHEDDL